MRAHSTSSAVSRIAPETNLVVVTRDAVVLVSVSAYEAIADVISEREDTQNDT